MKQILFKRLTETAKAPVRVYRPDACFDLFADRIIDHRLIAYGTGIAVAIPFGHVGLVFMRSSVRNTSLQLANAVGVIDPGYTGEIVCTFREWSDGGYRYAIGERIVQIMILEVPAVEFVEVQQLPQSERGENGLGSTGKS